MPTTKEEKRAYARGYSAGHRWPEHRPPMPPDGLYRELQESAQSLRDAVHYYCSTFPDDDPIQVDVSPKIDRIDDALEKIGEWLLEKE